MRKTFLSLAASVALLLAPALSSAASFTFSGEIDDGPLMGQVFSGSFDFAGPVPELDAEPTLTSFSLDLAGQIYTLASATPGTPHVALFFGGTFAGLDYLDDTAADPGLRTRVRFVPDLFGVANYYFAYTGAGGSEGFGSYSVTVVPEPAAMLLMLAGLGVVGGMARRARRDGDQAER